MKHVDPVKGSSFNYIKDQVGKEIVFDRVDSNISHLDTINSQNTLKKHKTGGRSWIGQVKAADKKIKDQ